MKEQQYSLISSERCREGAQQGSMYLANREKHKMRTRMVSIEGIGSGVYSLSSSSMGSTACFLDDEDLLLLAFEAGFDDLEAGAR